MTLRTKLPGKLLPGVPPMHSCIKQLVMTPPVSFITHLMSTENPSLLGTTVSTATTMDITLARVLSSFMMIPIQSVPSSLHNACSLVCQVGFCKWKVFLIHQIIPLVFQLPLRSLLLLLRLLRHPLISIIIPRHPQKL